MVDSLSSASLTPAPIWHLSEKTIHQLVKYRHPKTSLGNQKPILGALHLSLRPITVTKNINICVIRSALELMCLRQAISRDAPTQLRKKRIQWSERNILIVSIPTDFLQKFQVLHTIGLISFDNYVLFIYIIYFVFKNNIKNLLFGNIIITSSIIIFFRTYDKKYLFCSNEKSHKVPCLGIL